MTPAGSTTDSGREVTLIGVAAWSPQYLVVVEIDGERTVRPTSVVLAHTTSPKEEPTLARKRTKDSETAASAVMVAPVRGDEENAADGEVGVKTFDDAVEENTTEENQTVVDEATGRKPSAKDEPKEKQPSTAEVAVAWIVRQLEEGPKTKEELVKLAAESNPAKFAHESKPGRKVPRNTKWIVEHKKVGEMIPGNASGYYIPEGLDAGRNGGVQFVYDDEEKTTLRVK